ncbi:alpha/beta-hydrolase [Dendrothele bispora CBS 962.96]|uniref:Alpha/beta-hydrolase n=1 Tax=Dendrothele bispora (strain CBS 962.96) TaxID=1314807 RepID=A0A4S8M5Y6_DENBC|nr:alpha/beta-hydrolase [Dendrothele bispora CBS 962.96]
MEPFTATFTTPDGALLTYEIAGKEHLQKAPERKPFIFVCGMSNRRCDFDTLVPVIARTRPGESTILIILLTYDHRGIGDSKLPKGNNAISIEIMAKDLMHLISHLGWKQVVVCGFSMGGVITQQLVLLPYHPISPQPLPFKITHVVLAGTLCSPSIFLDESGQWNGKVGLKFPKLEDTSAGKGRPLTDDEKKELVRPTVEQGFDKVWLGDQRNKERLAYIMDRMIVKRPTRTIVAQSLAMLRFKLPSYSSTSLLPPPPIGPEVLIIHGRGDGITPWACAEELLRRIPHSRIVKEDEIDHLDYGHNWHEYFDSERWVGVLDGFIGEPLMQAKL